MSRKKIILSISLLLIGSALCVCLFKFFSVPPSEGNQALLEGGWWIGGATVLSLLMAFLLYIDLFLKWLTSSGLLLCVCWIIALGLVFSGLASTERLPKATVKSENIALLEFLTRPYWALLDWKQEAPYPAKIIYALLFGVVALVVLTLCAFLYLCLFAFNALIITNGLIGTSPTVRMVEDLICAALLMILLRCILAPVLILLLRFLFPATAIIVNDVALFLPRNAVERLDRGDIVEIRVWSGTPVLIAFLAGLLAVVLHFKPWEY